MNKIKRILKNEYIFSLIARFFAIGMTFLSNIIITRTLGVEGKGEYTYILNFISITALLFELGICNSYPFYKKKYEKTSEEYATIISLQFILYTILIFMFLLIKGEIRISIILILTPITIFSKQINFIVLVNKTLYRNIIEVLKNLLYMILILISVVVDFKHYYYLFVILYIKELFSVVLSFKLLKAKIKFNNLNYKFIIKTIKFGFVPVIISLLLSINYKIDIILLKYISGYSEVGLYSISVSLIQMFWVIPDAFKDVLFNKVMGKNAKKEINKSIKINVIINILIILFVYIFGNFIIKILYGIEFTNSYNMLLILSVGTLPMAIFKILTPLYVSEGKQVELLKILIISATVNIIMNIIIIPYLGGVGAAVTSVISYCITGGLLGIKYYYKNEE